MHIAALLPDGVIAVEHLGAPRPAQLHPDEEAVIANAVPARRAEFAAARECARTALGRLGLGTVAIPSGPDRAPVWPSRVVGSITHCDGYRAAAVGLDRSWAGIGIDAEVHAPLPIDVLPLVTHPDELADVQARLSGVCTDRVLFSAKESVYKVWSPIVHTWLGFEDVRVRLESGGGFIARVGPAGLGTHELRGRWAVIEGLVLTAVWMRRT